MSKLFGEIRQLAFVVDDINQAMDFWANTLGISPFFVKRNIRFDQYHYLGKPAESPTVSIALANSGFIQIELIQQHDNAPSIYKAFLDSKQKGLQHVSSWLTHQELLEKKAELLEKGYVIAQECVIPSSGVNLVYFATNDGPGNVVFEIADLMEPMHYERVLGIKSASEQPTIASHVVEVSQ